MGVSILDMSVSLDRYIADADDYVGGDDGERLHKWADAEGESAQPSAPIREFVARAVASSAPARDHGCQKLESATVPGDLPTQTTVTPAVVMAEVCREHA